MGKANNKATNKARIEKVQNIPNSDSFYKLGNCGDYSNDFMDDLRSVRAIFNPILLLSQ